MKSWLVLSYFIFCKIQSCSTDKCVEGCNQETSPGISRHVKNCAGVWSKRQGNYEALFEMKCENDNVKGVSGVSVAPGTYHRTQCNVFPMQSECEEGTVDKKNKCRACLLQAGRYSVNDTRVMQH